MVVSGVCVTAGTRPLRCEVLRLQVLVAVGRQGLEGGSRAEALVVRGWVVIHDSRSLHPLGC